MTKADVEAIAAATREELLARGLTADEADALLALEPAERRRVLVEALWEADPSVTPAESVLHPRGGAPRQTDVVGGLMRMRRMYPYVSVGLMNSPAAKDCPHATVMKGRRCPRPVRAPVVTSRAHERELKAKHGLERE